MLLEYFQQNRVRIVRSKIESNISTFGKKNNLKIGILILIEIKKYLIH